MKKIIMCSALALGLMAGCGQKDSNDSPAPQETKKESDAAKLKAGKDVPRNIIMVSEVKDGVEIPETTQLRIVEGSLANLSAEELVEKFKAGKAISESSIVETTPKLSDDLNQGDSSTQSFHFWKKHNKIGHCGGNQSYYCGQSFRPSCYYQGQSFGYNQVYSNAQSYYGVIDGYFMNYRQGYNPSWTQGFAPSVGYGNQQGFGSYYSAQYSQYQSAYQNYCGGFSQQGCGYRVQAYQGAW